MRSRSWPTDLDAVRPLPLGALPLLRGDVAPPGQSGPVRLDQLVAPVGVGLLDACSYVAGYATKMRVVAQLPENFALSRLNRRICVRLTRPQLRTSCVPGGAASRARPPRGVPAPGGPRPRRPARALARRDPHRASRPLNLDAASYRQLADAHRRPDGEVDGQALRTSVLDIVGDPGEDAEPGHGFRRHAHRHRRGGRPAGHPRPRASGDRVATLVSLSLTPLQVTDGLARWDGRSERVPAQGHAILFGRSIAARLPDDLSPDLALMVMDVCGAPALVARLVREYAARGVASDRPRPRGGRQVRVALAGRCGRRRGRPPDRRRPGHERGGAARAPPSLADEVVIADARSPLGLSEAVAARRGPGRHHRGLRRRPRVRAAGDPLDRPGRHHHLLLDGHRASRPRPSAPRASRPTCGCSSATATCPVTRHTPWTSCARTARVGPCSSPASSPAAEPSRPAVASAAADRGSDGGMTRQPQRPPQSRTPRATSTWT